MQFMARLELDARPALVEEELSRRKPATQQKETNMNIEMMKDGELNDEWFRARAKELYCRDGEVEVDSNARISYGADEGAYVEAWVWVPFEETESDSEDE